VINVYIVTYKKNDVLNTNLSSLLTATSDLSNISVTIINNYPGVEIDADNRRLNPKIVENSTRSLNSWGYLSRDWNFGILDCFHNWNNPDDKAWCVLAQNDVQWVPKWDEFLMNNSTYDMISQPRGDQSIALKIRAVRETGFFDERFSTLHFQEIDYFFRAIIALGDRVSINEDLSKTGSCSWNPVGEVITKCTSSGIDASDDPMHTSKSWADMRDFLFNKWSFTDFDLIMDKGLFHQHALRPQFVHPREVNWYPFFWDGYGPIRGKLLNEYEALSQVIAIKDKLPIYRKIWSAVTGN
jgi:hypothetical protein